MMIRNVFLYFSFLISIDANDDSGLGFSFCQISSIPVRSPRPNNSQGFAHRRSQGKKVPFHHRKPTGLLQIQVWKTLWPWFLMGFCNKIVVFLLYTFNWKIVSIFISERGFVRYPDGLNHFMGKTTDPQWGNPYEKIPILGLWDVKIEKKIRIIDDFLVKHEDDKVPCRLLRYTTMCVVI